MLLIDMFLLKRNGNGRRRKICQNRFSEILEIKKYVEGL